MTTSTWHEGVSCYRQGHLPLVHLHSLASRRDKVGLSEAFPILSPKENMTVSVAATEPSPDFSSSSPQSILQKAFKAPEVKDFKWRG